MGVGILFVVDLDGMSTCSSLLPEVARAFLRLGPDEPDRMWPLFLEGFVMDCLERRACAPLILSLVVPVFNEVENIGMFLGRVLRVFEHRTGISLEILFVNDGSTDATLERLLTLQGGDARIKVVDLSRNFGKEAAMTAGLDFTTGDVVVPIDVDLQDPPELILEMIENWREGYEVVLGRRIDRDSDTLAKRCSANGFYRLYNKLAKPRLPENVGDFRLMDRCVVEAIRRLPESQRFMKGLFAWAGFRTAYVDYVRPERAAGTTKFNGWKLWNLALEGITSFSTTPLRVWTYLGGAISLFSLLFVIDIAVKVLMFDRVVPDHASQIVAITFLGGLQLIGIGVIGEYLGRTYMEAKRRPIYIVRRMYNAESTNFGFGTNFRIMDK
jgi:glycosyltransferase involved in cell wall biosynthesis